MGCHFQFLRGKTDISGLTEYASGSNSSPHPEHSQIPYSRKEFGVKFPGSTGGGGIYWYIIRPQFPVNLSIFELLRSVMLQIFPFPIDLTL